MLFGFITETAYTQAPRQVNSVIENQLDIANELHMTGQEQKSLNIYEDVLSRDPDNIDALWNGSVLHSKIGYRQEDRQVMREHYETAKRLADRALEHNSDSGYAYYAKAVAIGRMTEVIGIGGKIDASKQIEINIEKAAERIPDFAPVWHLYGVWHSDIANLGTVAKTAVGLFSGGIPDASNEKAEEYLNRAVSLDQTSILFHLDLAKHYRKLEQHQEAAELFEKILTLEPHMKDDPGYIKQAERMLRETHS
jgi:tetratricopeptide (TPR) repeat protein